MLIDVFAKCGPHSRFLVNHIYGGGTCSGFCPIDLSPSADPKESYVWFSAPGLEMNWSLTVTVCVFDEHLLSEAAILMSVALLVWDCAFLFWAAEVSAFVSIFAVCLTSVLNPPRRAKYVNFKNDPVDRSYGWKKNWYYVCLVQKTISRESIRRKMSEL